MKIYALFAPPKFDDPDQERAARLLYGLLWLTIATFGFGGVVAFVFQPETIDRAITPVSLITVISFTSLALLRRHQLKTASLLFVVQLWLVVTISALTGGGMGTPAIQGYLLVILAAGLLIGWRWGLLTAIICTVTQIALAYAETTGLLPPYRGVRNPLTYLLAYTLISSLVVIFVYYYTSSIQTALNLAKQELSERKRAEQALRESEAHMRVFADATFEGIAISVDERIVENNEQFARMLGYATLEIAGTKIEQLVAPESIELIRKHIAEQYSKPYEAVLLRKDGTSVPVEVHGKPFKYRGQMARLSAVRDLTELKRQNLELALAYDVTLEGWSKALDLRDKETEGHSLRVTEMTIRLARAMGLSNEELASIRQGALLHDVGKLGIPDNILLKEGQLTDEERVIMCKHPTYAYEWLSTIAYLRPALDIPYCHHEKWDGSGYPRGLQGDAIPLAARLFAVVDVYDALTSDRPYRQAWAKEKVLEYINDQKGKHFDPQVVEIFMQML
jgi:PAS domain S-box-containing protein